LYMRVAKYFFALYSTLYYTKDMENYLTFVETSIFTKCFLDIGDDENLQNLQSELLNNPEKGKVIQNTGGLRKIRIALSGKGKRGGGRIIYLYIKTRSKIYLVYAYSKGELENLTEDDKKRLKILVNHIKQEVE
jgi:hypothetical protein